jgi:hypothetical protein
MPVLFIEEKHLVTCTPVRKQECPANYIPMMNLAARKARYFFYFISLLSDKNTNYFFEYDNCVKINCYFSQKISFQKVSPLKQS